MIRIGGLNLRPGSPRVAVPFFRKITPDAFRALRDSGMDIAEIRLDMSAAQTPAAAAELLGAFAGMAGEDREAKVPLIATARSVLEGGRWTGDEKSRRDVLLSALEFADAADVELSSGGVASEVVAAARNENKIAIVSRHNFSGMDSRDEMERALRKARDAGADIFKIACVAEDEADSETILDFVRTRCDAFPLMATAMGENETARRTRLDLARSGSLIAFAAADGESAPGQWTLAETVSALRG